MGFASSSYGASTSVAVSSTSKRIAAMVLNAGCRRRGVVWRRTEDWLLRSILRGRLHARSVLVPIRSGVILRDL